MPEPSSHSLIVIGAGLAGLYAASVLRCEFPDLLVLEATDRPGGRVRQVNDATQRSTGNLLPVKVPVKAAHRSSEAPAW